MDVNETLRERGTRYGSFAEQSKIACALKDSMRNSKNWVTLKPYQKESLDMIANKISRILNGDPDYLDNVLDISGYATLYINELDKD